MTSTPASASSPTRTDDKVQSGRVEKSKTRKGEAKIPTYRIGGRTFACEACKKGHRVSKCTHAGERPLSMTNDPGRPSADQKRHCDCPKLCSCTKKNCKCERNCSCTQVMYMLVYVPLQEDESGEEKPTSGEWQIGKEVITDLKGKELSEEEVKNRAHLKSLQQSMKTRPRSLSQIRSQPDSTASPKAPKSEDDEISNPPETPTVKSCCQHRKKIVQQPPPTTAEIPTVERKTQCNCGSGCKCAFCLDHPNNQTSQLIAQQQAAHFTEQSYDFAAGFHSDDFSWVPPHVNGSCMGTNPHFAMSRIPNPSPSQFQSLFPTSNLAGQGYMLSYPITRYVNPMTHDSGNIFGSNGTMQIPLMTPFPSAGLNSMISGHELVVNPAIPSDALSSGHANYDPIQFLHSGFDVGDAVIANFHDGPAETWMNDLPNTLATDNVNDPWFPELTSSHDQSLLESKTEVSPVVQPQLQTYTTGQSIASTLMSGEPNQALTLSNGRLQLEHNLSHIPHDPSEKSSQINDTTFLSPLLEPNQLEHAYQESRPMLDTILFHEDALPSQRSEGDMKINFIHGEDSKVYKSPQLPYTAVTYI